MMRLASVYTGQDPKFRANFELECINIHEHNVWPELRMTSRASSDDHWGF